MGAEKHLNHINILLGVLLCYRILNYFTEIECTVILGHKLWRSSAYMDYFLRFFDLHPLVDVLAMNHKYL